MALYDQHTPSGTWVNETPKAADGFMGFGKRGESLYLLYMDGPNGDHLHLGDHLSKNKLDALGERIGRQCFESTMVSRETLRRLGTQYGEAGICRLSPVACSSAPLL